MQLFGARTPPAEYFEYPAITGPSISTVPAFVFIHKTQRREDAAMARQRVPAGLALWGHGLLTPKLIIWVVRKIGRYGPE